MILYDPEESWHIYHSWSRVKSSGDLIGHCVGILPSRKTIVHHSWVLVAFPRMAVQSYPWVTIFTTASAHEFCAPQYFGLSHSSFVRSLLHPSFLGYYDALFYNCEPCKSVFCIKWGQRGSMDMCRPGRNQICKEFREHFYITLKIKRFHCD